MKDSAPDAEHKTFEFAFFSAVLLAVLGAACSAAGEPEVHVDHLILGTGDLGSAIKEFENATGVHPEYGGKHPSGTHNALVSLGGGTYLELIAPQPGAEPSPLINDLVKLSRLTPIGWAVSAGDEQSLRQRLIKAGFAVTEPKAGSRIRPSGATLEWRSFGLEENLQGAPFFIVWAPGSPHPSSTSPTGCKVSRFTVAGPNFERLARLRSVLGLPIEVAKSAREQLTLSLACPKGRVVFGPPPEKSARMRFDRQSAAHVVEEERTSGAK